MGDLLSHRQGVQAAGWDLLPFTEEHPSAFAFRTVVLAVAREMACIQGRPVRSVGELGRVNEVVNSRRQLTCAGTVSSQVCCSEIYRTYWLCGAG